MNIKEKIKRLKEQIKKQGMGYEMMMPKKNLDKFIEYFKKKPNVEIEETHRTKCLYYIYYTVRVEGLKYAFNVTVYDNNNNYRLVIDPFFFNPGTDIEVLPRYIKYYEAVVKDFRNFFKTLESFAH